MTAPSTPDRTALAARWSRPWAALAIDAPAGMLDDLLRRHAEPHRHYHVVAHVVQVVDWLEAGQADPALVLAGWFHDAVHLPGRGDNERRSAQLAVDGLRRAGLDATRVALVRDAILATAAHDSARDELAPLLDADLAILGAPEADYAGYAAGIRREYAHVPEFAFRIGRARFLRALLARPRIFRTTSALCRLEAQARRNLAAECAALEGG